MTIAPNTETSALDALDILAKFGIELDGQRLAKGGTEIQAYCPFHDDRTGGSASFYLNVAGLYYTCFGCRKGGYIYDVVEECTNLTRQEVKAALKGHLPLHYKKVKPKQKRERYLTEIEIDALTAYADGFHVLLKNDHKIRLAGLESVREWQAYLTEQRGFSWEAINHFRLGANALKNYNGYFIQHTSGRFQPSSITSKQLLTQLNLFSRRGAEYYWKQAIIIPYIYSGQVYYINARILPQYVNGGPKYMGMSGITRQMFFHEDVLDEYDDGRYDVIYAVEGELNAIAMWDVGIRNVVSFGSKSQFNRELMSKLFGCDVILYFDTDESDPEHSAREETIEKLQDTARSIGYFEMPLGIDPNDYLKTHTREEFEAEFLSKAVSIAPSGSGFSPEGYRLLRPEERKTVIDLQTAQQINQDFMAAIARNLPKYRGRKILNNMPIGTAKTTGALSILNSRKQDPALVLTSTHYLATDYDDNVDFDRLTIHLKGRGHPEIECPHAARADYWASRGYGLYFKLAYCLGHCEKAAECMHIKLLEAARTAPVLIATHAHGHLKEFFTSAYFGNNKRNLIIIDEEADLVKNIYFSRDVINFNIEALGKARDMLVSVSREDRITDEQKAGSSAQDLVKLLQTMYQKLMERAGFTPELQPFTRKEVYMIDKMLCSLVKETKVYGTHKNILHDLIYVINKGLPLNYDLSRDALYYTWRAEFPGRACVLFLTGTTPKAYLEKTLDIHIDEVVGQQYYLKRDNLEIVQLLNVTGGRQRVLYDKKLQDNIQFFFRQALKKHQGQKILILTSQGAGIPGAKQDGSAKERIIQLLGTVAKDAGRSLVAVETQHLEEGELPITDEVRDIPVIHYGIQGTNIFAGYEVLIEINAHYYHQQAVIDGVLRCFGIDMTEEKTVKRELPFRTLDSEYTVERYSYGVDEVDLYIEATQQADIVQAEGRILRGEDTQKTIYRLHNVNVEPYPDRIYKSWQGLFHGEFRAAKITGKLMDVRDWIQENISQADEFSTQQVCEGVGGQVGAMNQRYLHKLAEYGYIQNTDPGQGRGKESKWVRL